MRRLRNAVFAAGLFCPAALAVAAEPLARTDLYGDPLPAGAAVRLGTVRYRSSGRTIPPLFIAGDEKLIVSGHRQLRVMEVATGKQVLAIDLGNEEVSEICLPRDRRSAFTLGTDWSEGLAVNIWVVSRWDLSSGELLGELRLDKRLGCDQFAVTPGGENVVTRCRDETVRVWDFASGREIATWKPKRRSIDSLAPSPDGKLVAVSSANRVFFWQWDTEQEPESINVPERSDHSRSRRTGQFWPRATISAELCFAT